MTAHSVHAGDLDRFLSTRGTEGAPSVILRAEGTAGPGARVETAPTSVNPHSTLPPMIGIQADAFRSSEGGSISTNTDAAILQSGQTISAEGTSSCCFVPGTLVVMADGTSLPIERVGLGAKVLGADGKINEVVGIDTPILGKRRLFAINGGIPFITPEHPILTTDGWKSFNPTESTKEDDDLPVSLLTLGDLMVTPSGTCRLESAEASNGAHHDIVHTLNVNGNRTFVANGLVVYATGSYQV